jgi:hypothetical protein
VAGATLVTGEPGALAPITGAPEELIDRLMTLLDRSPAEEPHWWSDYGFMVMVPIGASSAGIPDRDQPGDRDRFIADLRRQLVRLCDVGIDEGFLVTSVIRYLDEWADGRGDVARHNERMTRMRERLQHVIDDPVALASFRRTMAHTPSGERTAAMSDEELIADIRRSLETGPFRVADLDEALSRWSAADGWREARGELLPDSAIERWESLCTHWLSEHGAADV